MPKGDTMKVVDDMCKATYQVDGWVNPGIPELEGEAIDYLEGIMKMPIIAVGYIFPFDSQLEMECSLETDMV